MCDKVNSVPFDTFKMFLVGVTQGNSSMRLLLDPMPEDLQLPPMEKIDVIKLVLANGHMICYWKDERGQEGYIGTIEHIYKVDGKGELQTLLTEVVATADVPKDFVEKIYSLLQKGPTGIEEDNLSFVEV
jgi:hypothetical protein